ncbi:DUF916 and DUF3324 domain-containing protein [Planococcus sp. MERTA32b]|nr:DUF916 and DUF3324 domain-containing protein [Planococcus sp. MER TA 32b]
MYLRVLIMCFMILFIPITVNAADSANDFDVKVLPAEGHNSFSEGYFHVDSEPGKNLYLEFQLTNSTNEPIKLYAEAVDAHTADKGGILYSSEVDEEKMDQIRLSELVDVQDTISVAPGSVETVHFHLEIPYTASGTILGGIMLTSADAPDDLSMEPSNKGGSNYTFEQPGQRLMAIKVNLPEKAASGFSLGKAKFDAFEKHLSIKLNNSKPAVLENVQGTYSIMDKEGKVIVNGVMEPFAMAPNSKINFPIDLKSSAFETGKYVLMIKGKADEKEFFYEENFTVTGSEEAGAVSQSEDAATPFSRENISRTVAISLVALFLLLPLLLKFNRRSEKENWLKFSEKNNI